MKNTNPQKFEARIFNTAKSTGVITYVLLIAVIGNDLHTEALIFEKKKQTVEAKFNGEDYLVLLNKGIPTPTVRVFKDHLFSIGECETTVEFSPRLAEVKQ